MLTGLRFHHHGLAVKNDADALAMLKALGYTIPERLFEPAQNVYVRLCTAQGQPAVEIVQPGDEGKTPLDNILNKHGELIYHTCYETPDLARTLAEIETAGLRCMPLVGRKPAKLFGGRHVSFYRIIGWGTLELLERN